MEQFDGVIIGAGPAGMMAAIRAAERDRKVLLIERNNTPGKKLLISGNGRCNLTNSCDVESFLEKFSESRGFLRNPFAQFFNIELKAFFENAGVELKIEKDGRVFPLNNNAGDILDVLISKLKNKNIKFLTGERVREIIVKDKEMEPTWANPSTLLRTRARGSCGRNTERPSGRECIKGVLTYSGRRFLSGRIAIATGGLSYPETGSTGDGYRIAEQIGHKIVSLRPALSPILIKENFIKDWQGISLKKARLTVFSGDKIVIEKAGEMIFTHFGLSGPLALDISASTYDALELKNNVKVSINFAPSIARKEMDSRLLSEFKANPRKNIKNIFKNFLSYGIIHWFLEYCGIDRNKSANQVTSRERNRLIEGLFDLRLRVIGVMPVKDGMVTRGGVNTKEINPKTMESRLIRGLFFAGEVIDIDAKTGGYNMQAAFSTGWVCGDNI